MINYNEIIRFLPKMKTGEELISDLTIFPHYNDAIRNEDQSIRLVALSNLYQIYIPSQMSMEIYSKMYLALFRSLQKKCSKIAIQQQYQNYNAIKGSEFNGIIGGSDSFTIIGTSGIGKSSAINRAISLITENKIITIEKPYIKIIPCIIVQCPFDSSVKGLLLEILRKVDECLESHFYQNAIRARATTDMLIGAVSQIALNHIGLLVIDEIQHIAHAKNGKTLIGALTQLINNSGISIAMIGTPECTDFFESAMQIARRSVGLQYIEIGYDKYFENFCKVVFDYQYVKYKSEINAPIVEWLYEHSGGIVSIVVSLIHDAQEIAILNQIEMLNLETLNLAFKKRLSLLHSYIKPNRERVEFVSKTKNNKLSPIKQNLKQSIRISELVTKSKEEGIDIIKLLREYFSVVEVSK